jgi:hypothetical protein
MFLPDLCLLCSVCFQLMHYYASDFRFNACLQHDLMHNPTCQDLDGTKKFCLNSWCYVDKETCKTSSIECIYHSEWLNAGSNSFIPEPGVDLFYSYTTCNSTDAGWEEFKAVGANNQVLGGIPIISTASYVVSPMVYKTDINGEVLVAGSPEYKNDSVPFEGVYISYMEELINYTNRSNSADNMYLVAPELRLFKMLLMVCLTWLLDLTGKCKLRLCN